MHLTWLGHSCFLLETAAHRLLFDPYLDDNPKAALRSAEVSCDFILCTHAHEDHIGDAVKIARRCSATIIAAYELAEHFSAQGIATVDMMPGGTCPCLFGRVTTTAAVHSSALEMGYGKNLPLGGPCGFIVEADGKTIYHAGDTALFSDMIFIGQKGLDLALLPIGDRYTMGIDGAVQALDYLLPRITVPMHYGTHEKIMVDSNEFARKATEAGHSVRVLKLGEVGEF